MKSKHFFKWMIVGASFAALAAACGDDTTDPPGTGGAGGTTSSTTTATGMTTTTTTSSAGGAGGTGGTGGGPASCDTATMLELSMAENGELQDPKTDSAFYKFEGMAGQQILVQISAKPEDGDPQDPNYIDSVATLFDATGDQIAENDDSFPRFGQDSQLFTILPAAGTYCVRVQDFSLWAGNGADATATDGTFEIFVGGINTDLLVNEAAEPNDTALTATPITYAGDSLSGYAQAIVSGKFADEADIDVYRFTLPADQLVDVGERASTYVTFFPAGPEASGSTSFVGLVSIVDPATDPPTIVAQMDITQGGDMLNSVDWEREFFTPLDLGKEYLLTVEHPAQAAGANDFYYFFNFPDVSSYPVETAELTNNVLATAETLVQQANDNGTFSYFVEGNILAGVDVDHFAFQVPPGVSQVSFDCKGWVAGSGLRSLKASLLKADGTPASAGSVAVENETDSAELTQLPATGPDTTMLLKVEAPTQSPTVAGDYYRCNVFLFEPMMP